MNPSLKNSMDFYEPPCLNCSVEPRSNHKEVLIMLSNPIEDALLDKGAHTTNKNLKEASAA